jgi:hypothetical protein
MRRELEAWNGRRIVVSGLAAWGFVVSLVCWAAWGLVSLLDVVIEVPDGVQLSLLVLALPCVLTIVAIPIFGGREVDFVDS